jgi:hypothetical protein
VKIHGELEAGAAEMRANRPPSFVPGTMGNTIAVSSIPAWAGGDCGFQPILDYELSMVAGFGMRGTPFQRSGILSTGADSAVGQAGESVLRADRPDRPGEYHNMHGTVYSTDGARNCAGRMSAGSKSHGWRPHLQRRYRSWKAGGELANGTP